ncbi:restriction endonuclease subunit S [Paenibacillus turicensis]|uniref:restriction endonuclease subunit S n=1 Tax=Paenibacillus turicensis TaxID=160487 RepID=UPI003D2DE63E
MINNVLRPYESYIDTGMDWLEVIPAHWEKISLRGITELSNKRYGLRNDLELLSVYREFGVVRKNSRDDNHNVESVDLSNYKYVDKGYLVLNKMKMWQGSLGISKYEGIVSPAYIVCKIKGNINFKYLHLLLRSPKYKTIYNRISYGVRVGQWDMRYDDFKKINLFIPPKLEQDQIVKYLDHQLVKINKFIKAKKKLIAVLKEQKQVIINEAVTKGLDSNVKMKPSGIEWFGNVPEHWECFRVKNIVRNVSLNTANNNGLQYIGLENVESWSSRLINLKENFQFESQAKLFMCGDILFGKLRPYLAKVITTCFDGVCSGEFLVLRTNKDINPMYIEHILKSKKIIDIISSSTYGAKMPRVEWSFIGNLKIYLPTQISEQNGIVDYLSNISTSFDNSIVKIKKEIELIQEYKNSLISDVVTGKVDVRNIVIDEAKDEIAENTDFDEELIDKEVLEAEDGD